MCNEQPSCKLVHSRTGHDLVRASARPGRRPGWMAPSSAHVTAASPLVRPRRGASGRASVLPAPRGPMSSALKVAPGRAATSARRCASAAACAASSGRSAMPAAPSSPPPAWAAGMRAHARHL